MLPLPMPLPRDAVLPDFGDGGLFGLARDLRAWLHDPARAPISFNATAPAHSLVVLLVIDGLGDRFLQRHGQGSVILGHRQRSLTSVFPSTTASAVTTLLTGLSPAQHGLTGWFIHDRRFGGVIAPLPLYRRGAGHLRAPFLTQRLFPYPGMFVGSQRPVAMVSPQEIAFSPYSLRHARGARIRPYGSAAEFVRTIVDEARGLQASGGFIHAYYPHFDALCHEFGAHSDEALVEFERIDHLYADLLERLAGIPLTLLLTADHGFIDAPEERHVCLERHPETRAMLATPLFGERRIAFCNIRHGAENDFGGFVREHLTGRAVLVPSDRLARTGIFGPGKAHRRLAERIGTHTLLMESGWTISDRVAGESNHSMIGVHGGLSAEEMWVPLVHACP
ncbi:MAG: alkaline phosphatase family protein [Azoarcus sp.]|nr:alkaline phosphatase family protein [Azoarcus sp.]